MNINFVQDENKCVCDRIWKFFNDEFKMISFLNRYFKLPLRKWIIICVSSLRQTLLWGPLLPLDLEITCNCPKIWIYSLFERRSYFALPKVLYIQLWELQGRDDWDNRDMPGADAWEPWQPYASLLGICSNWLEEQRGKGRSLVVVPAFHLLASLCWVGLSGGRADGVLVYLGSVAMCLEYLKPRMLSPTC